MASSISSAWWSLSWLSFHSSACADSIGIRKNEHLLSRGLRAGILWPQSLVVVKGEEQISLP
jgi:hypothetical protein